MAGKSNPPMNNQVGCLVAIVDGRRATAIGRSEAGFSVFVRRVLRWNRARPVGG